MKRQIKILVQEGNQELYRDYTIDDEEMDLFEVAGSVVDMVETLVKKEKEVF